MLNPAGKRGGAGPLITQQGGGANNSVPGCCFCLPNPTWQESWCAPPCPQCLTYRIELAPSPGTLQLWAWRPWARGLCPSPCPCSPPHTHFAVHLQLAALLDSPVFNSRRLINYQTPNFTTRPIHRSYFFSYSYSCL